MKKKAAPVAAAAAAAAAAADILQTKVKKCKESLRTLKDLRAVEWEDPLC